MNIVKREEKDFSEILRRILKRDFSGNAGLAIKNSLYQIFTNFFAKIGALAFTIIIARLLMPELFGLYSLALSTVLLFSAFSNLGIGETFITFVSRELGKHKNKTAKAYTIYFGKIKLLFLGLSTLLLIISAKFISNTYYQKPLFLALIAGVLYLISFEIVTFLGFILQATNSFKGIFHKEWIFQISRLILVPLAVLFSLRYSLTDEKILFYIILTLGISYVITALFMMFIIKNKYPFLKTKKSSLTKTQKKQSNKFLFITAVLILSGTFFSYIDKIMLGRFVAAEFIGYYSAALGLIGSLSALAGFGTVLLPLFARLKKKNLEKGLSKSLRIVFTMGLILFLGTLIFSPLIILIVYGSAYSLAINILRLLSLLLIMMPLIAVYSAYFLSRKKPQIVAKLLFISTLINIVLNYFLIYYLVRYGAMQAVFGASIATLVSQGFYLFGLALSRRRLS